QGDAVSIANYDAEKVLGYRRLQEIDSLKVPIPILKKGSKGIEVVKLQKVLNYLNYNCGDVDGDFGTKTKDALKLLQANNMITVEGNYDHKTKDCIESLLQT
ncbi:MAG: peptidoglycan-binding protein, partial [Flavobacteriales bacterium]|nr:peptidoglycan-binding protein [Flavobacteriales bacterium]